jgi:hypothetical protein
MILVVEDHADTRAALIRLVSLAATRASPPGAGRTPWRF